MSLRGAIYGSTILTRAEWGARAPRSVSGIPNVEMTTVHYAGPSDWGASANRSSAAAFRDSIPHSRCDDIMRGHQNFHMDSRGWSDYAYNGSACPHGFGFIGRGRGVRSAAQGTTDGNNRSYAIQYLGAGEHGGATDPLTEEAKRAFYDMAAYLGMPLKRGHRDWKSTSCPGEPTYAWRRANFPKPTGAGEDIVTPEQIKEVAAAVWNTPIAGAEWTGMNAPAKLVMGDIFWHARDARGAARAALTAITGLDVDVDSRAVAQEVLGELLPAVAQQLNPQELAAILVAALPDDIAQDVAADLAARLAS